MKHLLTVTTVIEAGVGLALLVVPSVVIQLLLGAEISGAAVTLGRVAGTALLALGVACWLARSDVQSRAARGVVAAMSLYNFGAVVISLGLPTSRRRQSASRWGWRSFFMRRCVTSLLAARRLGTPH